MKLLLFVFMQSDAIFVRRQEILKKSIELLWLFTAWTFHSPATPSADNE